MDLNIKLTPQLAEIIRHRVDSGLYSSASEVIHAALRLLAENDHAQNANLEQLRLDIQEGLDSAPDVRWDPEKVKELGRAKLHSRVRSK